MAFVLCRFKLLSSEQSKGLTVFVSTFALPAMIFSALSKLDFSTLSWKFLLAILLTKAILFFAVLVVTLLVNHGHNMGKAAIYAMFTTNSNDFAFGFPILKALYGQTNPEYLVYLFFPIAHIFLNPVGFALMEIEKARSKNETTYSDSDNQLSTTSIPTTSTMPCNLNKINLPTNQRS